MSSKQLKPSASTQEHLDLEDITDDLVILRTGWVALVMTTTAVNFDLLSEAEQDATIYAYGAFLNSLSFPVQTLIRNKKADITAYFQTLEEAEASQPNPDLKRQIQKYEDFLQSIVQQKTVLDKKFYLIVNYSPLEGIFKGGKKGTGTKKAVLLESAKAALAPKRDHVIKQTARLGLATRQLITQELIELFYDIYNPAPTGTQRVLLDNASYTTPIVEPAIESPGNQMSDVGSQLAGHNPLLGASPVSLAGAALPGGNVANLRPVPNQLTVNKQSLQSSPLEAGAGLSSQFTVNQSQTQAAGTAQGQALSALQQATAKAAAVVQGPLQGQTDPGQGIVPPGIGPDDKGGYK